MDRETALNELRKVANRLYIEAIDTTSLCQKLDLDDEKELKDFLSRMDFTLFLDWNKYDKLFNEDQIIVPEKTKEDIRKNAHKILKECFDFDKVQRLIIADSLENDGSNAITYIKNIADCDETTFKEFIMNFVIEIWLEELDIDKYLEIVNQSFAQENYSKPTLKAENIPAEVTSVQREKFWTLLNKYREQKGLSHSELYKIAFVSKEIYSCIRHMHDKKRLKNYRPEKEIVLKLCIALHLTLPQTQELLGILGYSLSKIQKVDLIVAWCLDQNDYDYSVDDIDYIVLTETNKHIFIK